MNWRTGRGSPSTLRRAGATPTAPPGRPTGTYRERGSKIVAPVVAALKLRDVVTATLFVEAEDVAQAIIETGERVGADAIVMGATRRLFNEMSWTSVSMTVTARSSLPVLLIPEPAQPDN